MWFVLAICFSWSWILRNVDFGEKLLWFVRCVWWKDNRGMGAYWGIFPSTLLQYSQPVYLRQGSPSSCSSGCFSQFYTHLLSHVFQMCESISVFAHKQACMLSVFALGSYNIRSQISTRFPGFQAKPSPHSTTFDTWVPAHFELI